MSDPVYVAEADKYKRIWAHPDYGKRSPGLRVAPEALEWFTETESRTLCDYGCGRGEALDYFREQGIDAMGVDIAPLRPDIYQGALWDLPASLPPADFAFSSDVLEHLPPEKVDASLAHIRVRTAVAGFFKVFLKVDRGGDLIGERLHLTVRPYEWWLEKVGRFFHVERHRRDGASIVMCVR